MARFSGFSLTAVPGSRLLPGPEDIMLKIEQVIERISEEVLADVVKAVKADERYAPIVARAAEQVLTVLASG